MNQEEPVFTFNDASYRTTVRFARPWHDHPLVGVVGGCLGGAVSALLVRWFLGG